MQELNEYDQFKPGLLYRYAVELTWTSTIALTAEEILDKCDKILYLMHSVAIDYFTDVRRV
jgi:hypothetical protein